MTRNEANAGLLAIMEALDVAGADGAPRGLIESGLVASGQYSADDAHALTAISCAGAICNAHSRMAGGSVLTLTARGRDLLTQARAFAAGAPVSS